ncbi:hypothetical protein [Streptomyces carpinensis]|uniref:hypothetical protein n=1 Tax=Streptomyces carpinensis TaxID=66369 RepID=UPI0013028E4D|nr:hypothetical protein [Streptomyces carpinensis]
MRIDLDEGGHAVRGEGARGGLGEALGQGDLAGVGRAGRHRQTVRGHWRAREPPQVPEHEDGGRSGSLTRGPTMTVSSGTAVPIVSGSGAPEKVR